MKSSPQIRADKLVQWIYSGHQLNDAEVLEVGAGTGREVLHDLRSKCKKVVGIDVDPVVLNNPLLDEAYVETAYSTHFPDGSFDIVLAINGGRAHRASFGLFEGTAASFEKRRIFILCNSQRVALLHLV